MNEELYQYGYVIDNDHILDCNSLSGRTIRYDRVDGWWRAYLEVWLSDDPNDYVVSSHSAWQMDINECYLEITDGDES